MKKQNIGKQDKYVENPQICIDLSKKSGEVVNLSKKICIGAKNKSIRNVFFFSI